MKDTSSCPNEGCRSSKECDKLRSATKHPKGIVSFANALKGFNGFYWQCCNGLAHLLADKAVVRPYYLAAWVWFRLWGLGTLRWVFELM
jgi:hypothetical protein